MRLSYSSPRRNCHAYGGLIACRASYFGGGAHDLETMKQWEIAQGPDVCETSLTYFLTPGVGVRFLMSLPNIL